MTKTAVPLLFAIVACGGKSEAPPAKPLTGAPVAFFATSLSPKGVELKAYNFSDKTVAEYIVLIRYKDAAGKVIKVKTGTPFEADFDWTSMSGGRYMCKPTSWCTFGTKMFEAPADAKSADVVAAEVTAATSDGHTEEKPLFSLENKMHSWPASVP
jgi:hypothetical protein